MVLPAIGSLLPPSGIAALVSGCSDKEARAQEGNTGRFGCFGDLGGFRHCAREVRFSEEVPVLDKGVANLGGNAVDLNQPGIQIDRGEVGEFEVNGVAGQLPFGVGVEKIEAVDDLFGSSALESGVAVGEVKGEWINCGVACVAAERSRESYRSSHPVRGWGSPDDVGVGCSGEGVDRVCVSQGRCKGEKDSRSERKALVHRSPVCHGAPNCKRYASASWVKCAVSRESGADEWGDHRELVVAYLLEQPGAAGVFSAAASVSAFLRFAADGTSMLFWGYMTLKPGMFWPLVAIDLGTGAVGFVLALALGKTAGRTSDSTTVVFLAKMFGGISLMFLVLLILSL